MYKYPTIYLSTNQYINMYAYNNKNIWSGHPPRTFDQVMRYNLQRKVKMKNTPDVKITCDNVNNN